MDLQKEYADVQPGMPAQGTGDLSSEYESAEPPKEENDESETESAEYYAVKQNMDMRQISKMVINKEYEAIGRYMAGIFNSIKK